MKPDTKVKCPFCGGEAVLRNPVRTGTQKKNWQKITLAIPRKPFICTACKKVFRNPA